MRRASAVVLVLFLAACATGGSWQTSALRTVSVAATGYDAAMTLAGQYYQVQKAETLRLIAAATTQEERDRQSSKLADLESFRTETVAAANIFRSAALIALQAAEIGNAAQFDAGRAQMDAAMNDLLREAKELP